MMAARLKLVMAHWFLVNVIVCTMAVSSLVVRRFTPLMPSGVATTLDLVSWWFAGMAIFVLSVAAAAVLIALTVKLIKQLIGKK